MSKINAMIFCRMSEFFFRSLLAHENCIKIVKMYAWDKILLKWIIISTFFRFVEEIQKSQNRVNALISFCSPQRANFMIWIHLIFFFTSRRKASVIASLCIHRRHNVVELCGNWFRQVRRTVLPEISASRMAEGYAHHRMCRGLQQGGLNCKYPPWRETDKQSEREGGGEKGRAGQYR